jgi:hypothetical protein
MAIKWLSQLLVRACLSRLRLVLSALCRRWLALTVSVADVLFCFALLCFAGHLWSFACMADACFACWEALPAFSTTYKNKGLCTQFAVDVCQGKGRRPDEEEIISGGSLI